VVTNIQAVSAPGKSLRNTQSGRVGGLESRSGRFGEEKNLLLLPGTEPRLLDCAV
jgi:hypothetical protein